MRERGATVCIVGEPKSPDALRNASDQFFEWVRPDPPVLPSTEHSSQSSNDPSANNGSVSKVEQPKSPVKRRPRFVVEAVTLLASDTSEGKVHLGPLCQYLKRMDPAFSPKVYGHSGLVDMLRTYDLLALQQEAGGHLTVRLAFLPALETAVMPAEIEKGSA